MKIGDRVRVLEEGNHFGKEGTVKKIDVFNLGLVSVEFRDGYPVCICVCDELEVIDND